MKKIINKLNMFKKGPAPYEVKGFRSGFVMLFAVTLSAILLSMTLGVATIAEREIKFGTTVNDANNAFAAADTGVECALHFDKTALGQNAFTGSASMVCNRQAVALVESPARFWSFPLVNLGSSAESCARVTVDKRTSETIIISKGYNVGSGDCIANNPTRTERQLEVRYTTQTP